MQVISSTAGLADGYRAGLEALATAIEPREPLSIPDWAAKYRILSGKHAAEPGRWRNERIPYLAEVMNALDFRHPAPVVVFVKSSQVGASECGINWIGRTVHLAPGSFLALFPTEKVGRKWVRTRLDSAIATTPELRSRIPLGRKMNSGNTLSEKHYPGGVLYIGSAGIPDDLASISVPYLLLEEVDRMPVVLEGEGDPIELARRRLATFARSKEFMNSSPTTVETSRVWPTWLRSTMDRYYVPCAHCGHRQHLRWAQVSWPAGRPEKAGYLCEECAAFLEERHKTEMLAEGGWRSTFPEREAIVKGFHVSGLYTPIGLGDSWGRHAEAWERAKGSEARIQVFFNTRLGEAHKGERIKVEWEEIRKRAEPYRLREIPEGVLVLTSGTDVQADRLETQILGHGWAERITVVDYVVHYGDPTRAEVWEKLDAYLAGEIENAYGVRMRIECSLVDSGYLTDHVLAYTRTRKARRIFASRGSTQAERIPIGRPSYPDVKRRGKTDARSGVERYEIGVSKLKHWLFELLRADAGTEEAPVSIADRHIRFARGRPNVPGGPDVGGLEEEYYRQLTAETFDPKHGWIERANYHRNEALDTFLLARAAAMHHSIGVHRYRAADYERLEALYERRAKVAPEGEFGKVPIATVGGFIPTSAIVKE